MGRFTEVRGYLYGRSKFPKLLSLGEASEKTRVSVRRLNELARAGVAPCVRIDDGPPLFFETDIVAWVLDNLIHVQNGTSLPIELKIVHGNPLPSVAIPEPIRSFEGRLCEFTHFHEQSCIYFLLKGDEVVYVGQSIKLGARVLAHRDEKDFDRVLFMEVPLADLGSVELRLIGELKPRLNVLGNSTAGKVREITFEVKES